MFLLLRHEVNVIYSKLVNNPFKHNYSGRLVDKQYTYALKGIVGINRNFIAVSTATLHLYNLFYISNTAYLVTDLTYQILRIYVEFASMQNICKLCTSKSTILKWHSLFPQLAFSLSAFFVK